jgi:hypothetical protein
MPTRWCVSEHAPTLPDHLTKSAPDPAFFGSSLVNTYLSHFTECPGFADPHEGSAERDTYMTFKM